MIISFKVQWQPIGNLTALYSYEMASNNKDNSRNTSSNKVSDVNRNLEISSLDDSESTTSYHDSNKIISQPVIKEQQRLVSSSFPNTSHNHNRLNTNIHRQYPNVSSHGSITYQTPISFSTNTLHHCNSNLISIIHLMFIQHQA